MFKKQCLKKSLYLFKNFFNTPSYFGFIFHIFLLIELLIIQVIGSLFIPTELFFRFNIFVPY